MLPKPRFTEYSYDIVFLFHPQHLLDDLSAPLPDNQVYCNCTCCERVDCLVHVTGEAKSEDPASNS